MSGKEQNMKQKKNRLSIALYVISVAVLFVLAVCIKNFQTSNAASVDEINNIPEDNPSYSIGSPERPFVVLEIVPYEGFASFGYLVAGEEPVNLNVCRYSEYAANILKNSHDGIRVEEDGEEKTFNPNDDLLAASTDIANTGITIDVNATQYGFYKKVLDGSGTFDLDDIEYAEDGVTIATASFIDVTSGGAYQLEWYDQYVDPSTVPPTDYNAEEVYTSRTNTLYTAKRFKITNRDLFKRECLNLTNSSDISNYNVKVITVTAAQLNSNLNLINRANLIYLTDRLTNVDYCKLWGNSIYRRENRFLENEIQNLNDYSMVRFTRSGSDLSWQAVDRIFKKQAGSEVITGVKNCPVIYDASCFNNQTNTRTVTVEKTAKNGQVIKNENVTGYGNNVYRLGLLLQQMDSYQIYQLLFVGNKINSTGSYTSLSGNARTYWNQYTLYPYEYLPSNSNIAGDLADMRIRYEDFDQDEFAHNNTYIYKNTDSLTMKFSSPTTKSQAYTKEVYEYDTNLSGDLTPAQVIKYLIDSSKNGENLSELTILQVEPGIIYKADQKVNLYKSDEYWKNYMRSMMPGFTGTVKVENQMLKEFNCRVEPLNDTYDLIYLGMNSLNVNATGDLAGLVYMHTGNKITGYQATTGSWIPGHTATQFTTRLSGNDITKIKKEELKEYAKAGYPIVLANSFMNGSNIDNSKIDRASYMNLLLKDLTLNSTYSGSKMFENKVSAYRLYQMFNQNLCYFDSTTPKPYQDIFGTNIDKNTIYINGTNENYKKLEYVIKIHEGEGVNGKYRVSLCIDMNADGRYDKLYEKINSITIKDDTGASLEADAFLDTEREYKVVVDISTYVGVITWQLSVDRYDSSNNYTGVGNRITGISAIKCVTPTQRVNLKILQIIKNNAGDTTIALPTDAEITTAKASSHYDANDRGKVIQAFQTINNGFNNNVKAVTAMFHYYTKDLDDYNLSFQRLTISQLKAQIINDENYLKGYDMLIIGFADNRWDIDQDNNDNKTLIAIDDYIKSGRTVLFTHDTSFFKSDHKFSKWFLDVFGMDRYGLTMMGTKTRQQRIDAGKDMVFVPNTDQETSDEEDKFSHGFTDQFARRYPNTSTDNLSKFSTENINQTNQGQITRYPYNIGSSITVAKTHSQYFQLDLENKDIVVWYTLQDYNNNQYLELNDGRNGYYIYNKGNITYSGAGHSTSGTPTNMTNEIKLFINTIIAAHRATPEVSLVEIGNSDLTSYNQNASVYVHYDSNAYQAAIGQDIDLPNQTKRVYFRFIVNGFTQNAVHKVKYYLVDDAGNPRVEHNLVTYRTNNNTVVSSDDLVGNTSYYIDVPISNLNSYNKMYVDFDIELEYGITEKYQLTGTRRLTIIRRGLFDMD